MKIEIDVLSNPKEFVEKWSVHYGYPYEDKYFDNIGRGLDDYDSFLELFRWKNGISKIATHKLKVIDGYWDKVEVLRELRNDFDWNLFEREFQPQKSGNIWKIFLLHIMKPHNFPIFDVHVFRFHYFVTNGEIREIPTSQILKHEYYKNQYLDWFKELRDKHGLNPKKMDESFFRFGQLLKPMKGLPIKLVDERNQ